VDPYQVLEARSLGAGGVLVILRMLPRERLAVLLDAAAEHGLFVLLEAFDAADLRLARDLLAARRHGETLLVGVNSRDLQSLEVMQERFAEVAPELPEGRPAVAESGVATAGDARRICRLGYRLALIGSALMTSPDPAALLQEIFAATRTVQR
jgi:indole-3-glycerol phosphate synthase